MPSHLPAVHVEEQQSADVVHASPFDVHVDAAATHLPPSHRFEQHSDDFEHAAPAAAAVAHAMPDDAAPSFDAPSGAAAISAASLPQLAADMLTTTTAGSARSAHARFFMTAIVQSIDVDAPFLRQSVAAGRRHVDLWTWPAAIPILAGPGGRSRNVA